MTVRSNILALKKEVEEIQDQLKNAKSDDTKEEAMRIYQLPKLERNYAIAEMVCDICEGEDKKYISDYIVNDIESLSREGFLSKFKNIDEAEQDELIEKLLAGIKERLNT